MKPVVFCVLAFFMVPCGLALASHEQQCRHIVDTRCIDCHYKSRICQVQGEKSEWEWKSTIKRMKKLGSKITYDEAIFLADCLLKLEKDSKVICD